MIDIKKLTKEDIGRGVVFTYHTGEKREGKIVSWDYTHIYVRYYNVRNPDKERCEDNKKIGLRSVSEDLEFTGPPKIIEIITRADLMDLEDD